MAKQTVQTLIKLLLRSRLIRVYTVCHCFVDWSNDRIFGLFLKFKMVDLIKMCKYLGKIKY